MAPTMAGRGAHCGCLLVRVHRSLVLASIGAVGWLAFLPNGPYLVTDQVHLGSGVELWRHVMQYGVAAWTGVILGVVSMHLVCQRIEREFCGDRMDRGSRLGLPVRDRCGDRAVPAVEPWDLVTQPGAVAATTRDWMRSPLAYVQPTGVELAVGAFFGLAYLTLWSLWPSPGPARA